ncbi:MAG: response regulator [Desulfobacterales bacterium]|jgi:CheY-like chemotaxis protein
MDDKTILIIEDDKLNMKLIRSVLQLGRRCRILEAESAEKGIQLAREHHPDLILMDIRLPGMSGLEATRVLKDDPDLNDIPVVALTAYDIEEDSEEAIDAGCEAFLPKPIDTPNFRKTIAMILSAYAPGYFQ